MVPGMDTVAMVAVPDTMAIVVILVPAMGVVLVVITILAGFFVPLMQTALISMVKVANILILAAGISSGKIYLYGFNKSSQVAFTNNYNGGIR
jgi:hypothetical protein